MSIFRTLAGYTYGHADIVRRAMSKKKASVLEAERADFVKGAEARGMTHEDADRLFDDMGSFANYAFNKSHAAAYALISYRTAYLKAHHPGAYFAALLTSVLGNQPKMAEYTAECAKQNIRVLPPDINESQMNFHASETGRGGYIRYGLLALKNVGEAFLSAILRERRRRPFTSFEDFLERLTGHDLNKRQVEALIKAGAFDGFPTHRAQLLSVYETMIETLASKSRANLEGQMDMFASAAETSTPAPAFTYPIVRPYSMREKLMLEREASGMFFSGQLLDDYDRCVASLDPNKIADIVPAEDDEFEESVPTLPDRAKVTVAGIVTAITVKTTKRDERMAFFTVEDSSGVIECLAFPKVYVRYQDILRPDSALYVEGNLSIREDEAPKVLVSVIGELVDNDHFTGSLPRPQGGNIPAEKPRGSAPQGSAQEPAAPVAGDRPRAGAGNYNPYESMPPSRAYNPYEDMPAAAPPRRDAAGPVPSPTSAAASPRPRPTPSAPPSPPQKLYLRVPDFEGEPYRKALNLAGIFCDGPTEVIFYDESRKGYFASGLHMTVTPFTLTRLTAILGEKNVVTK